MAVAWERGKNCEDWGWFIEYITEAGDEYWLCCSNREDSNHKWFCYLNPQHTLFGFKKVKLDNALPLLTALREILSGAKSIHNIYWS